MPKLTKSVIDRAAPRDREHYIWDDELKGFGVRITPRGSKVYLVRYRVGGGRGATQRKYRIGQHGSPWTTETARKKAFDLLAKAAQGEDPSSEREADRQRLTFEDFANRYLEEHAIPKKKASSVAEDCRLLRLTLLPAYGRRYIQDLTYSDVSRLHAAMKDTPAKANRAVALLSKMFSLAEQWGIRERHSNPCSDIKKYPENRRERFLSGEEIERLGQTLNDAEASGSNPQSIAIIRLLMLTGARKGEIIGLRWDEVDLERGLLAKRDSKTGQKSIPISSAAGDIIRGIPRLVASPYVFPAARGDGHFQGLTKDWLAIRAEAGLSDVRLHDLRHTFASISIERGIPIAVLSRVLGHASITTTERYAHLADNPIRDAVDKISSALALSFSQGERHQ